MTRMFQSFFQVAVIIALGAIAAHGEKLNSAIAFEQLSSLVGAWTGVQEGIEITLNYTLTADGSTLMEEFHPIKGPVMLTMFTVDGDHLIATHYCSAKNQPQMATERITEPESKTFVFSLVRVTGMKTPEDWHNTGLEVRLQDPDHFTQNWSYIYKGKTGTTTFHFTRKKSGLTKSQG